MQNKININIAVDSISALSNQQLEGSIWLMDNSNWGNSGQGTANLITLVAPGQTISWKITAVDLQTPAAIKYVSFFGPIPVPPPVPYGHPGYQDPDTNQWSAVVPGTMVRSRVYQYRLAVQIGDGKNSLMYIDSPALLRV